MPGLLGPARLAAAAAAVAVTLAGCGGSSSPRASKRPAHDGNVLALRVPSPGMAPTLRVGGTIHVDTAAYRARVPAVGDIIVFHPPRGADAPGSRCGAPVQRGQVCTRPTARLSGEEFIKRVVAGPGDRIRIVDGHVVRNGRREPDGYINPCPRGDGDGTFPREAKVPADDWFVLGDNRGASDDSRFWGPIPTEWIVGEVTGGYRRR